ncbi:hypothetical protein PFISCL1PPCAC_1873 [Pristionchus fissidentatus]|uniref:Aminotransferase class I/classII large domain-containing protein n=1 Tax=Pristionchus fissidentatus TaxID=1538716 RepID=A0AAV5UTL7_9BILA|nr:hypothetical protein PFISCL1PPCAC_1873 [Pristionchus fissidentatus]
MGQQKGGSRSLIEGVEPTTAKKEFIQENFKWHRGEYGEAEMQDCTWITDLLVRLQFTVLTLLGTLADLLRSRGWIHTGAQQELKSQRSFTSLDNHFEAMFVNNIYRIATDVVNRPLAGVPAVNMKLKDRVSNDYGWTYEYTGEETEVINLGSYNYLGFSHETGPCADAAAAAIDKHGTHVGSTRHEIGNHSEQRDLEECIARYLGVEAAITFPMGFGTNSMNIGALVDKNSLILSDALNHASLCLGSRMSGAKIKVFKHNDAKHCERLLRQSLCAPNPNTGKPYNKVLIIMEGIYSMEGSIVNLPEFIRIKKKYGAYLFLDEAHSVGALGPTGKGVVEYWGCDPRDIDIMMGTLTKSFAGAGGYIGGSMRTIRHIRATCTGAAYGTVMSPPVIAQVRSAMRIMSGEDGTRIGITKAEQLLRNTRYFRARLKQMGFIIYGHDDSPVVPLMMFYITKVVCFGRETLKRGIGIVSVAYPATPLTKSRARFCISADHTKEQLDHALQVCSEVGDFANTKFGTVDPNPQPVFY